MSDIEPEDKPPEFNFPAPDGDAGKPPEPAPAPNDKPPARRRGRPPGSGNKLTTAKIEEGLNRQFTLIGLFVTPINQYDGTVIIKGSPALAKALADVADKNPAVRKNLEKLLVGSSYTEVVIAASAILVPIMANHNLMPPGLQSLYGPKVIPPQENEENGQVLNLFDVPA